MKTPDDNPTSADDAWDDLFRQRLADYTDKPPADALARIMGSIQPTRSQPRQRWTAVSLLALVLIGVGGWLVKRQDMKVLTPETRVAHRVSPTAPAGVPIVKADPSLLKSERGIRTNPKPDKPVLETNKVLSPVDSRNETIARVRLVRSATADIHSSTTAPLKPVYRRYQSASRRHQSVELAEVHVVASQPKRPSGRRWTEKLASTTVVAAEGLGLHDAAVPTLPAQPDSRLSLVALLAGRPIRAVTVTASLPPVIVAEPATQPMASRPVRRSWFVSLTPLYNYQQIDPIHTDNEFVSDIRVAHSLAADRLGGRLQVGTAWRLTNRLSLRTSLVYQQVRQTLRYAVRSTQADSVQVVLADNQSVQVTPLFSRRNYSQTDIWHYVGVSADVVWQLNRATPSRWQHYLTGGATVGRYVSRGGAVNGFVQAAYGIERPLTPGLMLRVEPTIQVGWQALVDETQRLHSRPYTYGLALGLRFR